MSKTILVTGGAGYIGSHVVLALKEAGFAVVVVDDLSTGRLDMVSSDTLFLQADIADTPRIRQFIRDNSCAAVIHLAGFVNVADSMRDPLTYYRNNVCASQALMEACVSENIEHFVFSSSAAVYGNPDHLQVVETSEPRPISPYGWTKLMTERMLLDVAAATSMKSVCLRYFNVAGADPLQRCGMIVTGTTNLIKVLAETALGVRTKFVVNGDDYDTPDGSCIRDFIHVSDLAEAHVGAIRYLMNGGDSGVFNCGYGRGFSVKEVIGAVESITERRLTVEIGPRRPGDIASIIADVSKIRSSFDWQPQHQDLHVIVRSALAWERLQQDKLVEAKR